MKRVLLINQGKTENLGDKAIRFIFEEVLKAHHCEVDFAGYAQTQEHFIERMSLGSKRNVKSSVKKIVPYSVIFHSKYKKNIQREYLNIAQGKKYDLVIIGGGQLIKTKSVFMYTLQHWINIIKHYQDCPIVIAGIGVDAQFTGHEKKVYREILQDVDSIIVRDQKSQMILKEILNINAELMPDIVFAYSKFFPVKETSRKNKLLVMIYDYKALKKHFGTPFTYEEYYNEWLRLIKENYSPDLEVVLGYTTIGDKDESIKFSKYLKDNFEVKHEIENTDTIESLMKILESTKVLISGRMHGMLLGLNRNCEIVPFLISPKIESFKQEWLDKDVDIYVINKDIDETIKKILSY